MITLSASGTLQGSATSAAAVTYTLFGRELGATGETFTTLAQGQLPSGAGVLYTVPASTAAVVEEIALANTGSTAQTVTLWVDGSGPGNELASFVIPAAPSPRRRRRSPCRPR
jgi:hypothetical protein